MQTSALDRQEVAVGEPKRCSTCPQYGREPMRPRAEFTANIRYADGLQPQCRRCCSARRAALREQRRTETTAIAPAARFSPGLVRERPGESALYQRMFAKQGGRCGACFERETACDEFGALARLTFYKLVGTSIEKLICRMCLTVIQQTGASVGRCAKITAFLSGATLPTDLATVAIEGAS